jgi:Dyp-type peroxidase family
VKRRIHGQEHGQELSQGRRQEPESDIQPEDQEFVERDAGTGRFLNAKGDGKPFKGVRREKLVTANREDPEMTIVPTQPQTPAFTDAQLQQIQGFGIAGFRKDHQETLFVRVGSATGGKQLVAWLAPQVANAWEVGTFNALFKEVRDRTGDEPLAVVWTGLLVSATGLSALGVPTTDLTAPSADAFSAGMAARAAAIGDVQPQDVPSQWLAPFQPGANQVHLAVIVAADEVDDLAEQVLAISNMVSETGCEVVFQERGDTLPDPFTGHEHFGFKDGISQPAVLGYDDPPQPNEPPGVTPGELVLGFPDNTGATAQTGTNWASGSFVVFRRLRQHVAALRAFTAAGVAGANPALGGTAFAADMVGRWPDGAPVETNPTTDPGPGNDVNAFSFAADPMGVSCPVWAHVRKANPRDTTGLAGTADDSARHRMLRRGIPFGPALPAGATADDGVDRGLHFFSVVADLERQFEFVQLNWLNNSNFPLGTPPPVPGPYGPPASSPPNGPDPLVGEHDATAECLLEQSSGRVQFPVANEFVQVTAGEYFFLPSIAAIQAFGA